MTPILTLNDGNPIPQFGYGVFLVEAAEAAARVGEALAIGYRHIDTAQMYGNEEGVGEAIRDSGLARGEVFVTTKLNNSNHRPEDARRSFDESLKRLGMDHVDLFLVHWPLPTLYGGDFVSTWRAMESFKADGRARSIGVSNFQVPHLETLREECEVVPAVNQIEAHPYFGNERVRAYGAEHGILTQAWAPIGRGKVLSDPVITGIAKRLGRTPAQVVLRWQIQRGDVVFPKTVSRSRMEENFDVFGFELSSRDFDLISSLNQGEKGRMGPNPDVFDWVPEA